MHVECLILLERGAVAALREMYHYTRQGKSFAAQHHGRDGHRIHDVLHPLDRKGTNKLHCTLLVGEFWCSEYSHMVDGVSSSLEGSSEEHRYSTATHDGDGRCEEMQSGGKEQ